MLLLVFLRLYLLLSPAACTFAPGRSLPALPQTTQLISAFRMWDDHRRASFIADAATWFEHGDDAALQQGALGWRIQDAAVRIGGRGDDRGSDGEPRRPPADASNDRGANADANANANNAKATVVARVVLCRELMRAVLYTQLVVHRSGLDLHEAEHRLLRLASEDVHRFPHTRAVLDPTTRCKVTALPRTPTPAHAALIRL